MFKFLRIIFVVGPRFIYSYFTWFLRYARNPHKYPIEKRYERVRSFVTFLLKHFRVDYQIKGYEHILNQEKPFVLYVNHYSNFDPLVLVALSKRPISFVAKRETLKFPLVGKSIKILDSVTIDRDDLRSQVEAFEKTIEQIKLGRDVVIFPEGTRNRRKDNVIGEFKPGSFKLSYRTGATIIPCALYGTTRPLDIKVRLKKYPLWLTFFKPIEKEEYLQYNTVSLAPKIHKLVSDEVTNFIKEDQKYLLDLKTKKKKK